MSRKNITIAFLGDLTADVYVERKTVKLGGAALNDAIWAGRLGIDAKILSAVGDDPTGKNFLSKIKREEIDSSYVEVLPGETSSIEIHVSSNGAHRYGFWKPGVLAHYHVPKLRYHELNRMDALCATVYPPYIRVVRELCEVKKDHISKKPLVVFNFGDMKEFHDDLSFVDNALDCAGVLAFGLDAQRDESLINKLKDLVPRDRVLLITLGAYGSVSYWKGKTFIQPSFNIHVTDTTGAGDAFLAAFLPEFLKTKNVQRSLAAGAALASQCIQKLGAY